MAPSAKAPLGWHWVGGARVWNGAGYDILNETEAAYRNAPVTNWWLLRDDGGFPAGTPAGLNTVFDVWRYYGEDAARNGDLLREFEILHWPPQESDFEQAGNLQLIPDPGPPPAPVVSAPPLPPPPPVAPAVLIAPAPAPEGATPVPLVVPAPLPVAAPALAPDGGLLSGLATELAQLIQGTHPEQAQYPELASLCVGFTQQFGFPALVSTVADLITQTMVVR